MQEAAARQKERVYYNPWQFAEDLNEIVPSLKAREEKNGKKFTKIYAPLRGGTVLAVILSHCLSDEENGHKVLVVTEPPTEFEEQTLVVDDIADSGKTLARFAAMGFITITLYKQEQCSFTPTIWRRVKHDAWIVFWWERKDMLLDIHRI